MATQTRSYFSVGQRRRFVFASSIAPLAEPSVVVLTGVASSFALPGVSQVQMAELAPGALTANLCPSVPESNTLSVLLSTPPVVEKTAFVADVFAAPVVNNVFEPLKQVGRDGKRYRDEDEDKPEVKAGVVQLPLLDSADECIHGINKAWCAECSGGAGKPTTRERSARARTRELDLFDLILPILQPPFGTDFDNPISLPGNKSLYSYQQSGLNFLITHERALLADAMGIGKTIQAIMAMRVLFRTGKARRGIIICPKSLLAGWKKELWEWAPELKMIRVGGSPRERMLQWKSRAHLYLVSYDSLRSDIDDLSQENFDVAVLDEPQLRIKDPSTDTSKAVRRVSATTRWALTATPLENRIEDLISIFGYLKPGLLRPNDSNRPSWVKNAIQPYFLRRELTEEIKKEIGLGEIEFEEQWLELTDRQRYTYDRAEQEGIVALNNLGDTVTVQHALALITKLKQICNRDPDSGESCKLDYLREALEGMPEDEKALVFSQYPEQTLRLIAPELSEYNPAIYSGQLTSNRRDRIIEDFEKKAAGRVLLMSVKAGGVGLTITRANRVFHLDLWWNPAAADQAAARAYRIGQKRTVFVKTLYTVDTFEERIHKILGHKRSLVAAIITPLSETGPTRGLSEADLSDSGLATVLTERELFGLFGIQKSQPARSVSDDRRIERSREAGVPALVQSSRLVTIEDIKRLSPIAFERLTAQLFQAMRYNVRVTPRSHDGGVDIFIKKTIAAGEDSAIVQCKHYPDDYVGVAPVRELNGVLAERRDASRAILVTSGRFSADALRFASNTSRLRLVSGVELIGLLNNYHVSVDE